MDENPKPLIDLGRARRVKGRGFSIRMPLAERLRAARKAPQAVVKVTSFSTGVHQVSRQLRYITRNGNLTLEKDSGELMNDREEQKQMIERWELDFDSGKRSRDTASIVFSLPAGSSPESLRQAVRQTGLRSFPGHEWVFAIHEDKNHPHAHMIVKMRGGEKGNKLRLRKAELYKLRETFAAACREAGVRVAASPRAARGVGQKGIRQAVHHLRLKGTTPRVEKQVSEEVLHDLKREPGRTKPWESAMAARHALEKELYLKHARRLRDEAVSRSEEDRARWLKAAADLERFARTMPRPQTRRQALIEAAKPKERGKTGHPGLEMER
jgi:hypothetical protein